MANIKELAKACNVSAATVSNVLNGKPGASKDTRDLVMKKAKEMDYTPNYVAKNLKMKNTRSIGVIAEDMTIFSIPDIIDGITEFCEQENYQILLTNLRLYKKFQSTYYDKEDYYELAVKEMKELIAKQVDGIIYVAAHERVIRCIPENLPIPAVMAYGFTGSRKVPSVVVDDAKGTYDAIWHLIENGHKNIGVIAGKHSSIHVQERLKGYQRALRDSGILYDPDLVCGWSWDDKMGYRYAQDLIEKGVTAIFCMNDMLAAEVCDRLRELEVKIPEEISVVGYDDREISRYLRPALTTVRLPLYEIGYNAAKVMLELLDGEENVGREARVEAVASQLVLRDSVGKR